MAAPPEAAAPGVERTVALVGSAGGLHAIREVLSDLPAELEASVLVLLHLTPAYPSLLAQILGRDTPLRVKQAEDGDELVRGCVYVAAPNAHLLVGPDGRLRLDDRPPVHHLRPSADVLLVSAASAFDGRCLAIVLTGTGADGADGVR